MGYALSVSRGASGVGTAQIALPVSDFVEWRSAFPRPSCEESGAVGFDDIISVTAVGAFKPHPAVYRYAAISRLRLDVGECLMVSANSFDVMGAKVCGYKAAFVNRYGLPYEDSPPFAGCDGCGFHGIGGCVG